MVDCRSSPTVHPAWPTPSGFEQHSLRPVRRDERTISTCYLYSIKSYVATHINSRMLSTLKLAHIQRFQLPSQVSVILWTSAPTMRTRSGTKPHRSSFSGGIFWAVLAVPYLCEVVLHGFLDIDIWARKVCREGFGKGRWWKGSDMKLLGYLIAGKQNESDITDMPIIYC